MRNPPNSSATSWVTAACMPKVSACVSPTPTSTWSSASVCCPRAVQPAARRESTGLSRGDTSVSAARLARWWSAAGFAQAARRRPLPGKGWTPRVPAAIPESNDRSVYSAFLGAGSSRQTARRARRRAQRVDGVRTLAADLRSSLLALRYPTTTCVTDPAGAGPVGGKVRSQRPACDPFRFPDRFMGGRQVRARGVGTCGTVRAPSGPDHFLPDVAWLATDRLSASRSRASGGHSRPKE